MSEHANRHLRCRQWRPWELRIVKQIQRNCPKKIHYSVNFFFFDFSSCSGIQNYYYIKYVCCCGPKFCLLKKPLAIAWWTPRQINTKLYTIVLESILWKLLWLWPPFVTRPKILKKNISFNAFNYVLEETMKRKFQFVFICNRSVYKLMVTWRALDHMLHSIDLDIEGDFWCYSLEVFENRSKWTM